MIIKLVEEQIQYNANPYDRNEGDCVIRALSLAYDMNYNSVKSELNSLASKAKSKSNYIDTVKAFIEKHGYIKEFSNETSNSMAIDDVEDFARRNKHGVFVIYCTDRTKQDTSHSFHLVTIVDGKIYDTWDSSNYYVVCAWNIKSHNRTAQKILKETMYKIDEDDIISLAESLYTRFTNLFSFDDFDEEYIYIKNIPSLEELETEFENYHGLSELIDDKLYENQYNIGDVLSDNFDNSVVAVNYNKLIDGIDDLCYNYATDYLRGRIE